MLSLSTLTDFMTSILTCDVFVQELTFCNSLTLYIENIPLSVCQIELNLTLGTSVLKSVNYHLGTKILTNQNYIFNSKFRVLYSFMV